MWKSQVAKLEGQRVHVVIERVDEASVDAAALHDAWQSWVATGPNGPIPDDGEPEFP